MSEQEAIGNHLTSQQLSRLARQILIRTSMQWSGPHARRLAGWALADCDLYVDPDVFRRIMSVVFRLGRLHPTIPGLFRSLPVDVASISAVLDAQKFAWIDSEYGEWIVATLHQRLAANSYETTKRIAWVELFNRATARFEGETIIEVSLLEKCRLADVLWDIRRQRLERLAEAAAEDHGITVAELVDVLSDEYAMAPATATTGRERFHCDDVADEDNCEWLLNFAPTDIRAGLESKLQRLPAAARAQLLRRAWWMIREPIAAKMWTKSIQSASVLRELKVIAGGTHFRVLYEPADLGIVLLDIGLRRDLDQMIRGVKGGRTGAAAPLRPDEV